MADLGNEKAAVGLNTKTAVSQARLWEYESLPLNYGNYNDPKSGSQEHAQYPEHTGHSRVESTGPGSAKDLEAQFFGYYYDITAFSGIDAEQHNPPYSMQNWTYIDFSPGMTNSENNSNVLNDTQPNLGAPGMIWRSEDRYGSLISDYRCHICSARICSGQMSTARGSSWTPLFHAEISKLFERDYVWAVTQTMVSFIAQTLWLVFRVYPEYWGLAFRVYPTFWGRMNE